MKTVKTVVGVSPARLAACGFAVSVALGGCLEEEDVELRDDEELAGQSMREVVSDNGQLLARVERQAIGVAEASPPGCNRGAFCAYANPGLSGALRLETQGNWSGRSGIVGSVFNNGVPFPGADHVQMDFNGMFGRDTLCIHYNPGPGTYKWDFPRAGIEILRVRWRGECRPGEDELDAAVGAL